MTVDELRDRYIEFQMEGNPDLAAFLDRVTAGGYGPVAPDTLDAFLDTVEADIVSGVETMAATNPFLAEQRDDVLADRLEWLRQLREKYVRKR